MKRISFKNKKISNEFFHCVFKNSNQKRWKDFYEMLSTPKATCEKYKCGKLSMPENLYQDLFKLLLDNEINYFRKNAIILPDNWGQINGGKITYKNYREIFENGRRKGIEKMQSKLSRFDINLVLEKNLSYFIGLFIAEGFTNKYGRYYLTQFTGHLSEEYFYEEIICKFAKETLNIEPKIRKQLGQNYIRVNFYSKDLFSMITKRFNIKAGRKSYDVLIPDEIINSSKENLFYCISGIFDGEACFFVDKRKVYSKPYPRIDLHMVNPGIIKQISEILNEENIKHGIVGDYSRINIYGDKNVKDFLKIIGFSNIKHLKKIENHFGDVSVKKLI